jgi:tetratricopeptide (TPR) repeat protein
MPSAKEETGNNGLVSAWGSVLNFDRERLDSWCSRGILGLVLAVLVWSPLATGAVRPQDFVIVEWLTVAILGVWLLRFWVNPKHRLLWPWMCWPILGFVIYAVGRYLTADIEFVARQEMIQVLVYAVIFFAVLNNLHRQETTQTIGMVLLFIGMAISFYALIQFLTESDRVWNFIRPENYHKRGSGTFICPNNLAGYLEMLLPIGLAYTLTGRLTHLQKVLVGYASLAIFVGIVVSVSGGGWIATGLTLLAFVTFVIRQRGYRWQVILMVVGLLAVGALFVANSRFSRDRQRRLDFTSNVEDFRYRLWVPAAEIWKDNLLWGAGPAHFDYRFRQYRPASNDMQARPDRAHNDYVNTLADWGLVGFLIILSIWALFYWEVFRSWSFVQRAPNDLNTKRSNKSTVVLGGALGLLAILLHSFVDFNMHIPANAILAVTIMALVAGHFRFATDNYWRTVRWPLRIVVSLVLLAGMFYLSQQTWRRTLETASLGKAENQRNFSEEQTVALKAAFRAEDMNAETAYAIGENYRMRSWQGGDDYRQLAGEAMQWFEKGMRLNPWDPYNFIRYGMCLHWIGSHEKAEAYFKKAYKLDPNGFYTVAHMGWHYVQLEDWIKASEYFRRSWELNYQDNPIASTYLSLVTPRISEQRSKQQMPKNQTASVGVQPAAAPAN